MTVKVYGILADSAGSSPAVPTGLFVEDLTAYFVSLSWDSAADATQWTLYMNGSPVGLPLTSPSALVTGLIPSTTYSFQVQASNLGGSSALSTAVQTSTSSNSAPLWDLTDYSGVKGINFSLNLNTRCDDIDGQPLSFSIVSGTTPGLSLIGSNYGGTPTTANTYPVTFDAFDGYAHSQGAINFIITDPDVVAPTVPSPAVATANGTTVTMTFGTSTDASGIKQYKIYQNGVIYADSTLNPTLFTNGQSPYVESGIAPGTYTYSVSAVDNSANHNESAQAVSPPITVVVVSPGPDVPVYNPIVVVSTTELDHSWSPSIAAGATPTAYELNRSLTGTGGWSTNILPTPLPASFPVKDTGLTPATQYFYRLRAFANNIFSNYATRSAATQPVSGSVAFIIDGTATSFDCRSATPVDGGVKRKVQPGEIVQFNERPAGGTATTAGSTVFEILYPEGTAALPIRFVPQPNKQIVFRRTSAGTGGFMLRVTGPPGASVSAADRVRYGWIIIDGTTTSGTAERDGRKHGFKWLPASSSDNATNMIKQKGFLNYNQIKRCHFAWLGGAVTTGGISANESTFKRTDYPGTYRNGFRVTDCLLEGIDVYMGSNYQTGALPHKDYILDGNYFYQGGQTPILLKNGWGGGDNVHHNVVIGSGRDQSGTAIQRNCASMTACNGEFHHNWLENPGLGVPGLSVNNNVYCCRFTTNDGPPRVAAEGYPGFQFITLKVYDNVLYNGIEKGFQGNSAASGNPYSTAQIAWYRLQLFNNTIDNFSDEGIDFGTVDSGSFARNNIVTRTNGFAGVSAADIAKNFETGTPRGAVSQVSAVYVSAGANFNLVTARSVHGTSVLGTDVATSGYGSPIPSLSSTNDPTISTVTGADMGAFQYP